MAETVIIIHIMIYGAMMLFVAHGTIMSDDQEKEVRPPKALLE